MSLSFHIVIPARYQSFRFPGKLLMSLCGKSVLERTYHQAFLAQAQSITIATDDEQVATHARRFCDNVMMTCPHHHTGTDRIAEVAKSHFSAQDIIVNVQGDEPFISPLLIQQVAKLLEETTAPMSTLCWPIESLAEFYNPNVVKVVRSQEDYALYFSRSPIPLSRDKPLAFEGSFRHIGLYAYRASFLLEFVGLPVCALEQTEALEQLRALWTGVPIKVAVAVTKPSQDINTKEDLILAEELCKAI